MVCARRESTDDRRIRRCIQRGAGDDLLEQLGEMPPEQENVASRPPGRKSFSASRLISLYARAAL